MSKFIEKYASTTNKPVVELFTKLAGDKVEEITAVAEQFHYAGKHFERSLADALETFKRG